MKWDDNSLEGLYFAFRAKMHEVYRRNRRTEVLGSPMAVEFNAWQDYLRNTLKLPVEDRDAVVDRPEVVTDRAGNAWVKIPNPSNGASHGKEMILVPKDLAEKIVVLGSLPEAL